MAGRRADQPARRGTPRRQDCGRALSGPVFYVGLHQPSDARHFGRACISVGRLRPRRAPLPDTCAVLLDSGAFMEISTHGDYRSSVAEYAGEIVRLTGIANIVAAVAQDWMCEPWIIRRTGLSVLEHQRRTVERYDALLALSPPVEILPVLQGYQPQEYAAHVAAYGDRLEEGAWVGVGSVCKRNGSPGDVLAVLSAIKDCRPDLRLHAFGIKKTALAEPGIRALLATADSMAWSLHARKNGRRANDWREAYRWLEEVETVAERAVSSWQMSLPLR